MASTEKYSTAIAVWLRGTEQALSQNIIRSTSPSHLIFFHLHIYVCKDLETILKMSLSHGLVPWLLDVLSLKSVPMSRALGLPIRASPGCKAGFKPRTCPWTYP